MLNAEWRWECKHQLQPIRYIQLEEANHSVVRSDDDATIRYRCIVYDRILQLRDRKNPRKTSTEATIRKVSVASTTHSEDCAIATTRRSERRRKARHGSFKIRAFSSTGFSNKVRNSDFCEAKRSFVPSETAVTRERRGVQGWRDWEVAKKGGFLGDSGRRMA